MQFQKILMMRIPVDLERLKALVTKEMEN